MIAAAVLAAGASRRLGRRKQLLPTAEGPLLRVVTERVCAARVDEVAVVLGAHREEIAPSLAGLAVEVLANDAWSEGMGSSVRVAATWAAARNASALLLVVCDQSELHTVHLDALLAAAGNGTAGSAYAGTVGVPAVFPAALFPSLRTLAGDRGARDLLRGDGVIAVPWSAGERDVDTPEDVIALTEASSHRRP